MVGKLCNCSLSILNPSVCKNCGGSGNLNFDNDYNIGNELYFKDPALHELQTQIKDSYNSISKDNSINFKDLINTIKDLINYKDNGDNIINVRYYSDDEFCVELFESEIMIIIKPKLNKVYINFDILEGEIDTETLEYVVDVMKFLKENINTFKL